MAPSEKDIDEKATAVHSGEDDLVKSDKEEHEAVVMPEDIRNMSEAEIESLRKKMVRKMDMVIM